MIRRSKQGLLHRRLEIAAYTEILVRGSFWVPSRPSETGQESDEQVSGSKFPDRLWVELNDNEDSESFSRQTSVSGLHLSESKLMENPGPDAMEKRYLLLGDAATLCCSQNDLSRPTSRLAWLAAGCDSPKVTDHPIPDSQTQCNGVMLPGHVSANRPAHLLSTVHPAVHMVHQGCGGFR